MGATVPDLAALALLVAALAAAGAAGGLAGGALRCGGGALLFPIVLTALDQTAAAVALPALIAALGANLLLSIPPAQRTSARLPAGPAYAAGGALGGGVAVAVGPYAVLGLGALALVLAGVAMVAPLPRLRAGAGLAVPAGALGVLCGAGGGSFAAPLLRAGGRADAAALAAQAGLWAAAPALAVMLGAGLLLPGLGVSPLWALSSLPVALAAWLTAPLGSRLAADVPLWPLRASAAVLLLVAGFSTLRLAVGLGG